MEKSINIYQRRLLRKIIKTRNINNVSLYKFTEEEEWTTTIKLRRLKWFGHLCRLPENTPAKKALKESIKPYKKIKGGQRLTWIKIIKRDFNNKSMQHVMEMAQDRGKYRKLVFRAMSTASVAAPVT